MTHAAPPGTVQIRSGVVSIAALLVTVAALTTLVIVVAIREADLLSVVALALAIVAFSAQLIIYVVQTAESAAVSRRSLELHVQLSELLSELRERTGNTQRSVDSINSRLLEAVIGKTESSSEVSSPSEFAARVAQTYVKASRTSTPSPATVTSSPADGRIFPEPMRDSEAEPIHRYMSTWPSAEEVDEIEATLRAMSTRQLASLSGLADDLWRSTRPGATLGAGLPEGVKFTQPGITEKVNGWKLRTLGPEGRRLGRVFTARGNAPAWALNLLALRDEVEQRDARSIDYRDHKDRDEE